MSDINTAVRRKMLNSRRSQKTAKNADDDENKTTISNDDKLLVNDPTVNDPMVNDLTVNDPIVNNQMVNDPMANYQLVNDENCGNTDIQRLVAEALGNDITFLYYIFFLYIVKSKKSPTNEKNFKVI